jgi:hypothetical protein
MLIDHGGAIIVIFCPAGGVALLPSSSIAFPPSLHDQRASSIAKKPIRYLIPWQSWSMHRPAIISSTQRLVLVLSGTFSATCHWRLAIYALRQKLAQSLVPFLRHRVALCV